MRGSCWKWGGGWEIKADDDVDIWKEYTTACKIIMCAKVEERSHEKFEIRFE